MWYVAWFVLAFESPSVHPTITYDERSYIELTAVNMEEVKVPYCFERTKKWMHTNKK